MGNKLRVLVVEDDESIREGVRELLEWEECEVETAPEGKSALTKLRSMKQLPQLIFLDLNMPIMSGHEFLDHLRTEKAKFSAIPVVVMTAVPGAEVEGVAGLLRKPMEISDLVSIIDSYKAAPEAAL